MKDKFTPYLKGISLTRVLTQRVESILNIYQFICPDEIIDIFISEFINDEGKRMYESLWLFSEKFVMEAKQFANKDDVDITPIKNKLSYVQIEKENFDFKEFSDESRMVISWEFDNHLGGTLKASKKNCEYLLDIYKKHFLSNWRV